MFALSPRAFCSSSDPTNRAAMISSLWAIADAHMLVVTGDRHTAEVLDQLVPAIPKTPL